MLGNGVPSADDCGPLVYVTLFPGVVACKEPYANRDGSRGFIAHILGDVQQQLQDFALPDHAWPAANDMALADMPQLQVFTAVYWPWPGVQSFGSHSVWGHTPHRDLCRTFWPGRVRGLDFFLPPGLGKETHFASSAKLPSPFRPRPWPEPDDDFALHAIAVWQDKLPVYAAQCRRQLDLIAVALQPLEDALASCRSASARRAAKKPAMMAFLTATALLQLVEGYLSVGAMETSGVFRSVPAKEQHSLGDL